MQGETGRVDHIKVDGRRHPIVVVFDAIHVPPFGGRWADSFAADELEIVEP